MSKSRKTDVAHPNPTKKEIVWEYLYDRRRVIVPWIVATAGLFTIIAVVALNQEDTDLSTEEWAELMRYAAKLDEEHLANRER